MTPQRFVRLTATSLSLGALAIGLTASKAPSPAQIEKLLAKGDMNTGIAAAEAAVAAAPTNSATRAQLGRAYLQAGRFASAEAAFQDVLTIDPSDGASALKLALVKIALGKNESARAVLEANRDRLGGADYGLAIALSGDTNGAVSILEAVTRAPGADAKARQNLALAYAMQGKWLNARVMAVQDLPPADADARIIQWMNFVRPTAAHDQVAALLGVTPATSDSGQPVALALAHQVPAVAVAVAAVSAPPEAAPEVAPVIVAEAAPPPAAPVAVAAAAPTTEQLVVAFSEARQPTFAAARQVVQPIPMFNAAPRPSMLVATKPRPVAPSIRTAVGGRYVVQLGAFDSEGVAQQSWRRTSARLGVAAYTPSSAGIRVGNVTFVRLSVGGFQSRGAAVSVCEHVRQAGGRCFVRLSAGDQMASWARPGGTRVATR